MMGLKRHYTLTYGAETALHSHISNESFLQNPPILTCTFGDEDFNGFRVTFPSGTVKYKGVFS